MKKILLGFIAIGLLTFVGCEKEKQKGCTEPNAINFDSAAEENDGSCRYEDNNNNDSNTNQDSTEIVISLPTLNTTTILSITETSAVSGGNITSNGGATVTSRGVCWGTSSNPTTIKDNLSVNGSGAGSFASNLSGLTGGTTYYVRAYAINSAGTSYGNELSFTTTSPIQYGEGVTDLDGNTYQSVIIGEQEWMSENLRVSKYNDGTDIPGSIEDYGYTCYDEECELDAEGFEGQDNVAWANTKTGAWCHYDNDNQYETTYGKLYNWYAVQTGKLCPLGWHVPTDADWTVLTYYLAANGHNGTEGTALKATSGWDGSGNGTDNYGWSALPGGKRDDAEGDFNGDYSEGQWWSSSQSSPLKSSYIKLFYYSDNFLRGDNKNNNGYSVRCLRD